MCLHLKGTKLNLSIHLEPHSSLSCTAKQSHWHVSLYFSNSVMCCSNAESYVLIALRLERYNCPLSGIYSAVVLFYNTCRACSMFSGSLSQRKGNISTLNIYILQITNLAERQLYSLTTTLLYKSLLFC